VQPAEFEAAIPVQDRALWPHTATGGARLTCLINLQESGQKRPLTVLFQSSVAVLKIQLTVIIDSHKCTVLRH